MGRPPAPEELMIMSLRIPVRLREILVLLATSNRRNISQQTIVVLEAGLKALGITEPIDRC
jgi:hypothetical protein